MRLYSSSRGKSNRCKSRSELQMFSLISGGHVCAPPRGIYLFVEGTQVY